MSKRENSSLILQNLKKRDFRSLGETVVPLAEAERRIAHGASTAYDAASSDSKIAISHDSYHDSEQDITLDNSQSPLPATKLRPRERVARSALIVRLNPALHRELEEVARFNRLTMNDIATEALELHLRNFPHPPAGRTED